jgi:hypothetical protein
MGLEHPEWTALQQLQAARGRCTDAIVLANAAVARAERPADEAKQSRAVDTAYNQALKKGNGLHSGRRSASTRR